MTSIDLPSLFNAAIINAISGLVANIFYILLVIWAVRTLVRNVPKWLDKYEKIKMNEMLVASARKSMDRSKE